MAKKNIHPKMYSLEVIMPDGEKIITQSTLNKGSIRAEMAFREHPAWTGEGRAAINKSAERVEEFNKRFGGITAFDLED